MNLAVSTSLSSMSLFSVNNDNTVPERNRNFVECHLFVCAVHLECYPCLLSPVWSVVAGSSVELRPAHATCSSVSERLSE